MLRGCPTDFDFFWDVLGYIYIFTNNLTPGVHFRLNEVHTPPMSVSFLNGENPENSPDVLAKMIPLNKPHLVGNPKPLLGGWSLLETDYDYPLVNCHITMETTNHHVSWENPLFLWSCSIAILTLPEILLIIVLHRPSYNMFRREFSHLGDPPSPGSHSEKPHTRYQCYGCYVGWSSKDSSTKKGAQWWLVIPWFCPWKYPSNVSIF